MKFAKAIILVIVGVIAAIALFGLTAFAFIIAAEPPEISLGSKFYDVTETLGTPTSLYIDPASCKVYLHYSLGIPPFERLMSVEINTSGTITGVKLQE